MSELTLELDRLIQKAAIDGALTPDAIKKFNSVLEHNEELANEVLSLQTKLTEREKELSKVTQHYNDAYEKNGAWANREKELKDREEKCTRLEVEAECNEKRVQDHRFMFETVFKGIHMRKQVVTPGNATVDQYGTRQQEYPDTTPVTEEE